jgi:hypothetical protein
VLFYYRDPVRVEADNSLCDLTDVWNEVRLSLLILLLVWIDFFMFSSDVHCADRYDMKSVEKPALTKLVVLRTPSRHSVRSPVPQSEVFLMW